MQINYVATDFKPISFSLLYIKDLFKADTVFPTYPLHKDTGVFGLSVNSAFGKGSELAKLSL